MRPERPWMILFRPRRGPSPKEQFPGSRYHEEDLAYMESLAAAVVQRSPRTMARVLAIVALALLVLLVWMSWAQLDTTVRGAGRIIPSSQLQVIQSLEGGVVSEILVREGELVKANQPLLKISDVAFTSSLEENRQRYLELRALIARLRAEADGTDFEPDELVQKTRPALLQSEQSLYRSNLQELDETLRILREQVSQQRSQLEEAGAREKQVARSLELVRKEIAIKKPLVQRRLVSEVDFLQLQQREAELAGELDSLRLSLPRLRSVIEEAQSKVKQSRLDFRNQAREKLNEAMGEASRIAETQTALADRVKRSTLRSPMEGTVKRILANTIGGVVKSGSDIIEIVPLQDELLVEARVNPADIADIGVGQKARLKFSAYDFAIYGSLEGEVTFISADTVTNEEGESFYIARIRPARGYLEHTARKLPLKVGMTSQVDIITGKKTIMQYVLKPIYRAMDNALTEG